MTVSMDVPPEVSPATLRALAEGELREHVHRVLARALKMRLDTRVHRVAPGHYEVPPTQGKLRHDLIVGHAVTGPPKWTHAWELSCDCSQVYGQRTVLPLCVHRAAVLIARWRSLGMGVGLSEDGRVVVSRDACDVGCPPAQYPALARPTNPGE